MTRTAAVNREAAQAILTVAEIERRYPDEWVLVEIVRDHRRHERVVGRLLAHSSDRRAVYEAHGRFRTSHPEALLYQFYTGDVVAEGVVAVL